MTDTFVINDKQFWQFSTEYYALPDVTANLLRWQNEHQANVNFALLCIYLETLSISLTDSQIAQIHHQAKIFEQAYTQPLRELRAFYKKEQHNLTEYTHIRALCLEAELLLEKQQQAQLVDALHDLDLSVVSQMPHTSLDSNSPPPQNWKRYQTFLLK